MRRGYKNTEIGEIPTEWEVRSLSSLGEFSNGINKGKNDFGFGLPFVNLQDVFGVNEINEHPKGLVNANLNEIERFRLKRGDVLFIRSSVKPEGVGQTAVVTVDLKDTIYSGFLIRFRSKDEELYLGYKKYCFSTTIFRSSLLARSSINANTNINQPSLETLIIPLPPLPEQKKIAEILSSVDEAIRATRAVIDQAKVLKRGMLDRLLTKGIGHTKFKMTEIGEIPAEWEVAEYNEVCEINKESLKSSRELDYKIKYLDLSSVIETGVIADPVEYTFYEAPSRARRRVKNYNILVSTVRPNLKGFALIEKADENLIASTGFAVLSALKNCSPLYLWQNIQSDIFMDQIVRLTVGSNYPAVNSSEISELLLPFPPLPEQKKIAGILTSVDEAIRENTEHLNRLKIIKSGLMQDLLTGKKRVV